MKRGMLIFDKKFINNDYKLLFNRKHGIEILEGVDGKPDPFYLELPSLLDIGIMGTCINKCDICYQGHTNKPNMSLDNFKIIIDQVSHHVNQVALGGRGDPNKHENFKEIIEYCIHKGVVPNYTTSGIGLTDEEVEISKQCGAVAVSEYGQYYTYRALNMFINSGIKTNIHMIFTSKSFHNIIKILSGENVWKYDRRVPTFQKDSLFDIDKLNAVIFLLFKPQGEGKHHSYLVPYEHQIIKISDALFDPKCKFKVGMDSCLVNHAIKYAKMTSLQRMSVDTCEGARMSGYITSDMRMKPCSFCDDSGTIICNEMTIYKIWNESAIFENFRNRLRERPNQCPAIKH